MLLISSLHINPIKSLAGIAVEKAMVTSRGLQYDRRWLLIDESNRFLTQRNYPQMALLQTSLTSDKLLVQHKKIDSAKLEITLQGQDREKINVVIWNDTCSAELISREHDEWFSEMLGTNCRLVYMPDDSIRMVDSNYAHNKEITAFSDGYPILIIGQASLDDLNNRMEEALPTNRFRPNIVFTGGEPFLEDRMSEFYINEIQFFGVKSCERCVITTINQDNAEKLKEPLKTLATYRTQNNKIMFGQNLLFKGEGLIRVGDEIQFQQ